MARSDLQSIVSYLRRLGDCGNEGGTSDAQLLSRFVQSRDEAAFELLVWRHCNLVLGICHRILVRHADVEDAFQATFLALSLQASHIMTRDSAAGWLAKVAVRIAQRLRSQLHTRSGKQQHLELDQLPAQQVAEDDLEKRELWERVMKEIARLPIQLRQPIVACYLECKTHEQAAQELGYPLGSMSHRLQKACRLLQSRLNHHASAGLALLTGKRIHAEVWPGLVKQTVVSAASLSQQAALTSRAALLANWALSNALLGSIKIPVAITVGIIAIAFLTRGFGQGAGGQTDPLQQETISHRPSPVVRSASRPGLDLYDDPLPKGALARLGSLRGRLNSGMGKKVEFTADGKWLITCADDGSIRFWSPTDGKEYRPTWLREANDTHYRNFALAGDGEQIATYDGKDLVVRNIHSGRLTFLSECDADSPNAIPICFAPNRPAVAIVTNNGSIKLFDTAAGKKICNMDVAGLRPQCLAFTANGKTLRTVGDRDQNQPIREWDADTGRLLRSSKLEISPEFNRIRYLAFSPGADKIAVEGVTTERVNQPGGGISVFSLYRLCLFDATTGKELLRTSGEKEPIWAAAFSHDGQFIATGGMGPEVAIWDTQRGNLRKRLQSHADGFRPDALNTLVFSPDGTKVASVGDGVAIQVWNAPGGDVVENFNIGHRAEITALSYSSDSNIVATASSDRTIRLWNSRTSKETNILTGHSARIGSLAFSPSAKLLASSDWLCQLIVWDPVTGKQRITIQTVERSAGRHGGVCPVAFSADGKSIWSWSGDDQHLRNWDVQTGKQLSAQPTRFAGRDLINSRIDSREDSFNRLERAPQGARFSPDGRLLAVAFPDEVFVVETASAKERFRFPNANPVTVFAFSSERNLLAFGGWGKVIHLVDLNTGKKTKTFPQSDVVQAMEFSPDGRTLAASIGWTPARIALLQPDTGISNGELSNVRSAIRALAFAPDGNTLASGQRDSTALIWDLKSLDARGQGQGSNKSPTPAPKP
jgi:RNA polymerase sigma factor (sigma-70 family)